MNNVPVGIKELNGSIGPWAMPEDAEWLTWTKQFYFKKYGHMAHNDLHIWIKYLSETNLPLHPHNRNLSPSLALILIKISRPIILLPIPNMKTKNLNAQHLNQRAQSMTQRVQNVDPN